MLLGVLACAVGVALVAYDRSTRPRTLSVAVGSADGEAARLMSALATQLASSNAPIRLKVVDTGSALDAAKALAEGKAELAVVRGDVEDLPGGRAVAVLTHGVVMVVATAAARADDLADLATKRIGVLGAAANKRLVDTLVREYGLTRARFSDVALGEARQALQANQIDALLVVLPLADRYLATMRELFAGADKLKPVLLPIEAAGAIAAVARHYESYELPKGVLRGAPPVPAEDVTTLRVALYLVADKTLDDDSAAVLAKAIMDARTALVATSPILAHIGAPNTEKDATMPVHPGAAAYFTGSVPTFFEKYGDWIFYGSLSLGFLTSALAGIRNFVRGDARSAPSDILAALDALADRVRRAGSEAELGAIDDELDRLLKAALAQCASGDRNAVDPAALNLAVVRVDRLMARKLNG